jgi:hypothetical protein
VNGRAGAVTAGRRSAPLLVAGLACVLLGGLSAAALYLRLDDRVEALVAARPLAPGQVIADADLGVVEVAGGGLALVPASDRAAVVGRPAAVAIPQGALLTPASVGEPAGLGRGEAVVGLALKAGQHPGGLRAGDRVAVVDTEGAAPAGARDGLPRTITEEATVVSAVPGDGTATTAVSLRVPRAAADAIVAAGAAQRASLVLLPPAP